MTLTLGIFFKQRDIKSNLMKTLYTFILILISALSIHAQVVQVTDVNPGALDSNPDNLIVYGDELIFVAQDPVVGRELHRYNSTTNEAS